MKRFVLILLIAVVGITTVSISGSPRPTSAGAGWGTAPLLNCPDLNGDGAVSGLDLFAMISSAGSVYGVGSNYLFLHDRNADKAITFSDFLDVLSRLGERCPLIDTQVAQATLAMIGADGGPDLRDWAQARDTAGYVKSTQYVTQMGIHVNKNSTHPNSGYTMNFDPTSPIGLVYTDAGSGVPGELIGAWYVIPNDEVCAAFGVPGPCQPPGVEPVGFGLTNTDEDNTDLSANQQGWHGHTNLCIIPDPPRVVEQGPNGSDQACTDLGGILNFETYAWMVHLYNFIPNPDGRLMMWNSNLP